MIDNRVVDICELLFSICEDENVYNKDLDLVESGVLDSFAFIELFSQLEEFGITIYPTRVNKDLLRTVRGIEELIDSMKK